MNYFTHAVRYLDRPYFAAGVCIPDWLNVVNRKARVRRKHIEAALPEMTGDDREIALGIRKHLDDDRWFHGTEAFYRVTAQIAASFREQLGNSDQWQCGFLGHITMELLLDAVLIEPDRDKLEQYYQVLDEVDNERIQSVVGELATDNVDRLSWLIEMFVRERFIDDYLDDERLLFRLNQVMKRINLPQLPASVVASLNYGRRLVRTEVANLLPENHFPERHVLPDFD